MGLYRNKLEKAKKKEWLQGLSQALECYYGADRDRITERREKIVANVKHESEEVKVSRENLREIERGERRRLNI